MEEEISLLKSLALLAMFINLEIQLIIFFSELIYFGAVLGFILPLHY